MINVIKKTYLQCANALHFEKNIGKYVYYLSTTSYYQAWRVMIVYGVRVKVILQVFKPVILFYII